MNDSIWQMIASTPWWAFVLFAYLLYVGYLASKPSTLPLRNLMFASVVFVTISIVAMIALVKPNTADLACWATMLLLGTGTSWLHYRLLKIKAIKDQKQLQMPGTYNVIILVLATFTAKYYYGYNINFRPDMFQDPSYALAIMSFYGFFTGAMVGRIYYTMHTIKYGPFVRTTEQPQTLAPH
jgi:hypothetical protein